MNQQRPLVPDGSASASSSHHDAEHMSTSLPRPPLPQRKKKPGPKRDSKPAPSEKLERNRQAQRTHRERKEQYTKDLELEVLRLKELFVSASRERDGAFQVRDEALRERDHLREANRILHEENQRMRQVIQASSSSSGTDSGYDAMSLSRDATRNSSFSHPNETFPGVVAPAPIPNATDSSAQLTGIRQESVWEAFESRGFASDDALQAYSAVTSSTVDQRFGEKNSTSGVMNLLAQQLPAIKIDYDEFGLDFILSLERPCMGHIQYLHVRAHNYQPSADGEMAGKPLEVPDDGENQHISGHSLMATATPYSHLMDNPGSRYPTQYPPDLKQEDLLRLLDLSSQLSVDERELPPVKAWQKITRDGRLGLFSFDDLQLLKQTLVKKVNCYRFGAVIDDIDIEEAMNYVLEAKQSNVVMAPPSSTDNRSPHERDFPQHPYPVHLHTNPTSGHVYASDPRLPGTRPGST